MCLHFSSSKVTTFMSRFFEQKFLLYFKYFFVGNDTCTYVQFQNTFYTTGLIIALYLQIRLSFNGHSLRQPVVVGLSQCINNIEQLRMSRCDMSDQDFAILAGGISTRNEPVNE